MTEGIIENDWKNIPSHKALGLDGVSFCILKEALPAALHKKDSSTERRKYHPISVLPTLSKPLEQHISVTYQKCFLNFIICCRNSNLLVYLPVILLVKLH